MKRIQILLLFLAASGIVFPAYVPAQTKQAFSCCCCSGAVCACDCNKNGTGNPALQSPSTSATPDPCDFNKCNRNLPVTGCKNFILSGTDSMSKKKLAAGLQHSVPAEKSSFFSATAFNNACDRQLSLPPPLFIKNTSLLL
jgi:hypothetical protein